MIFYCLRFETPTTWRARSPYLYSPRNKVDRLYPQVPGSHFFASYDSQGYVEVFDSRLYTGLDYLYILEADPYKTHPLPSNGYL
jgi:hypothetical protein